MCRIEVTEVCLLESLEVRVRVLEGGGVVRVLLWGGGVILELLVGEGEGAGEAEEELLPSDNRLEVD